MLTFTSAEKDWGRGYFEVLCMYQTTLWWHRDMATSGMSMLHCYAADRNIACLAQPDMFFSCRNDTDIPLEHYCATVTNIFRHITYYICSMIRTHQFPPIFSSFFPPLVYVPFVLSTGYYRVLSNMRDIITALKSTPGATYMLTGKYKQGGWMTFTENPTEYQLVTLALRRIQQDPNQYYLFIDMLRDIPGMDLTVNRITSFGELYIAVSCVLSWFIGKWEWAN